MHLNNLTVCKAIKEKLTADKKDLVLKTAIRATTKVDHQTLRSKSIFQIDQRCSAARDYYQLAEDICDTLKIPITKEPLLGEGIDEEGEDTLLKEGYADGEETGEEGGAVAPVDSEAKKE
jgi:hypothetical protein